MPRAVAGERPELASIEGLLCFEGGRVREPEELLGLSDVLAEALYYGGPTSLSGREFHERLAARGASLEVRATDDALELEFRTPPGELASVLDAAAELARFPHYPPEIVELARERLIDRLEAEADDPSAIADAELAELVFGSDDPFVRRASCATAERIGRGELLAFHRAHVGRDRLWAAAVGPIDSATLEREVARAFAGLPVVGPVEPLPETRYATAGLRGVVFSEGTTIEQRLWSPGIAFTHPDYAAMRIWSDVVGRRAEGGAFFQVRWTGPVGLFGFVSSPPDEAIARAKRIELENYVEGPALDPIAPELFEAARTRVLEAHASAEGSARSLLEPLRYGADPGFWKQHGASLAAATPETVAEAARRCVLPSSWITVGVFPEPPTEWESFADKRWRWPVVDGTRPLRGNPEAVAVLERLFAALGGRTAWAALEGLALEGEVRFSEQGEPFAVAIWRDLAGERLRIEEDRGGTERVQIATPAGALAIEGGTVEPLHEDVHAAVVARERALLYRVLRELARATTHSVELDGDGRLAVRRRGRPLCAIEIGPDGLPARVNVPESSLERARATEYLDWAPHGSAGLFFARETRDGPTQADARRFLWRSIDPDWAPSDASFSAE
jgi:predicted Zn-dependent peptidase